MQRVSVPGKVFSLLWTDDEFYRDVTSHKKVSTSGKFPKCDQWCDEDGFHMAFALAGYSPSDVSISVFENEIQITGTGNKNDQQDEDDGHATDQDEYPIRTPKVVVHHGMIVRGIARRNFKTNYFVNPTYDLTRTKASMKNGLLEILVPQKEMQRSINIMVEE